MMGTLEATFSHLGAIKYGVPLSFKTGNYPPTVHALLAPYKGVAMPGCCLALVFDLSGEGRLG